MQALKHKQQSQKKLKNWYDLWFADNKKTGYVAVTNFKKELFFGSNDIERVIKVTKGKKKRYISINAFHVDWENKIFSRKTEYLKQIRNIAIDIDQYNLNLTIEQALDEIQSLIVSDRIPEPNLVLTSRGIQLFYTIYGGASPDMAWLAQYITEQLIEKLDHVGADSNAKDMSRVMRVPYSVNERNNAVVQPYIWNDTPYTLDVLESYCRPLEEFETRKQKRRNITHLPRNKKLMLMYKTNNARRNDLLTLLKLRKGDLTHMRNVFLYIYSYHQSLILNTKKAVVNNAKAVFRNVYSRVDKPFTKNEFESTVKSAYDDAREFFNHFKDNGYNVVYKHLDGIKKPYNTSNIIKKLNITEKEQKHMRSIRNSTVKKEQHANYMRNKRRSKGIRSMEEYNNTRKQSKQAKINELKRLMDDYPNATNKELKTKLGVSLSTLKRYKREVNI